MQSFQDVKALRSRYLCHGCVDETFLSQRVRKEGSRHRCFYCSMRRHCFTLDEMSEIIEEAFEQYYIRTPEYPDALESSLLGDRDSSFNWTRRGYPVVDAIEGAAQIPPVVASDIQSILEYKNRNFRPGDADEETEFADDSHYDEKAASDHTWHAEWLSFVRSLKTESRFFSREAADHLDSVFAGIEHLKAHDGRPIVTTAGPGKKLRKIYRARVFQSQSKLEHAIAHPDSHLGSPPAEDANAGRMNARGISVFYGATKADAAIAEVRPPVGSYVAVARFEFIRPVCLLDLTALNDVIDGGSIFDPTMMGRLERAMFLRTLSELITRPVMPDDEAFDYLPTQAIADFLAARLEPLIDGIVFPSVQAAGNSLNVVLFHKAARVESIALPEGTEVKTWSWPADEDGNEHDYNVFVETPDGQPVVIRPAPDEWDSTWLPELSDDGRPYDYRRASLRVDADSVVVHHVSRVKVVSKTFKVNRRTAAKQKPDF
jgi:hypothetical protein